MSKHTDNKKEDGQAHTVEKSLIVLVFTFIRNIYWWMTFGRKSSNKIN